MAPEDPQRRRAEDKIEQIVAFHAKLVAQIRAQHEALAVMERQLKEALDIVRANRAKWPHRAS
jgi:hypothetical protein